LRLWIILMRSQGMRILDSKRFIRYFFSCNTERQNEKNYWSILQFEKENIRPDFLFIPSSIFIHSEEAKHSDQVRELDDVRDSKGARWRRRALPLSGFSMLPGAGTVL
jgi:hypothetical protein